MKKVHFLHTIALLSLSLTGQSYCAAESKGPAQEANSGWVSSAANAAYNLLPSWPSWRSAPAPAPAEQVAPAPAEQPVAKQYVPSVNEFEFAMLKRRMRAIDKEIAEKEERERQKNLEK
ncbi:MAG: hypothetical protein NT124_01425 [Candidatus Dependentiae bacterium]|nr:hypothetical protein [Candidatus Dependentiae bacterium]